MSRWKKGESGNPNGRPKGALNKSRREIKEILEQNIDFEKIVLKLEERALKGNDRAAEILLAYRYGKPVQRDVVSLQRDHHLSEDEQKKEKQMS